jgi:hypothetical protein
VPTDGLSLVGFVDDRQFALVHLKSACLPNGKDEAQLTADWESARGNLGPPNPNAGRPAIHYIPADRQTYLQQPAMLEALRAYPGAAFMMVEIAPLLAFQLIIDTDLAELHCAGVSTPPTLDELLSLCLPTSPQSDSHFSFPGENSFLLKSRTLNLQIQNKGLMNIQTGRQGPNGPELGPVLHIIGAQVGLSPPYVLVSCFNDRYYLSNGYHRVYGAMLRGATEIPCIVREVASAREAGIREGSTLSQATLESANPPTLQHYHGPALPVSLRQKSQVIVVQWNQSVMFDEYD